MIKDVFAKKHKTPYKKMCMEVERLAKESGHKVLWSPPCFSDLNLIEMLWAYVKNNVADQYSDTTSFQDVQDRLDGEFPHPYTNESAEKVSYE